MQVFEIIVLGFLAILPQLGSYIYSYLPKKRSIRAQILNKSLYVFSYARTKFFVGGIIINDPRTTSEESALEFAHKIQEYLPLTLKLGKSCTQACLYIYLFDFHAKMSFKSNFDERIQKAANIFETLFTPRNIQIMTGRELYEAIRGEYGKIHYTEDELYTYDGNKFSRVLELMPLHPDDNWKQRIFLLNCMLELGLEVSLSFNIKRRNTHIYSAGQIRINGDRKDTVMGGIKILRKGGSLLLKSSTEPKFEQKDFHHQFTESALQIVPYLKQKTHQGTLARVVQFCVQNAPNSRKHSFSVPKSGIPTLLDNRTV